MVETRQTCPQCEANVNEAERLYLALGATLATFVQEAPQTSQEIVWHGCNEFVTRVLASILLDKALDALALEAEVARAVEQFHCALCAWVAYDREQQEREG
jgi:hypothetical protein